MIVECPGCKSRYDVSGRPAGTRARCRCGTEFRLPDPSAAAGSLSCPGCGAVVATGASRCAYCSAELLVRACPRCFARIFHGHTHCPHCGVVVGVPARANPDGSTTARACPRCDGSPPLIARVVGDVLLDECSGCRGVWLDAAAVDRVVRERQASSLSPLRQMTPPAPDLQAGASSTSPAEATPSAGTTAATVSSPPAAATAPPRGRLYIACPDCGQLMNRVNFARHSGVILDVCRGHGTWFDATELPRVVDFVMKGGVEESQRREVDELREQARRAAADAEAARARAAWSGTGGHEPHIDLFGAALGIIGRLLH
ncbi:MAG TPA: zf-TFIIB domain-containing protein [Kofleriaceae bacterium]|nr:zf-TFIIB domain-containing protein [Kofleriaceae bacterium]